MRNDENSTKINNWLSIDKKRFKKSMLITAILFGAVILVYNFNDNKNVDNIIQDNINQKNADALNGNENIYEDKEFKSAIGNLYTGVTLYAEEKGQMEPYFTVLDKGKNVKNPGGSVIKNGVLVKEITSGDTYWKDVDRMIKDSTSSESYIIKYYVKSDDQYLP